MLPRPLRPALTLASVLLLLATPAGVRAADDSAFLVGEIPNPARTASADIGDLDGDGRSEVFVMQVEGLPPSERRTLRVHYPREDGGFAAKPDFVWELPRGAAAYDLAELDERPGMEIVLMRRGTIDVLSLSGRELVVREIPLPVAAAAPLEDERGIDRLRLSRPELGPGRLLVPGLGEAVVLAADGTVLGNPRIGGRANFFLPPRPGPAISENELEMYFDVPRMSTADVDGDGLGDLVASTRHYIRVFTQRADGTFPTEPDQELPLRLVKDEDHIRNTAAARVQVRDWNGDGRADLLVNFQSGGLLAAKTQTRIHRNVGGTWNVAEPDQIFERSGGLSTEQLIDLDFDGRPELVRAFTPISILEMIELFMQREIDAQGAFHRPTADGLFAEKPYYEHRYGIGFDFEKLRPSGFIPTLNEDINGDGQRDLISSSDGTAFEVYLGGPTYQFRKQQVRQEMDTDGRLRFGDLDGDGLRDWVLYSPRRPLAPVRVGRNLGRLPGTRARQVIAEP